MDTQPADDLPSLLSLLFSGPSSPDRIQTESLPLLIDLIEEEDEEADEEGYVGKRYYYKDYKVEIKSLAVFRGVSISFVCFFC